MKSFLVGVASALAVSFAFSSSALADDCRDAAKLKKDGNTAFGAAQYPDALAAYERAYACDKDTSLLFNMAQAQLHIGQYLAGLESMRRFQRESPDLPPEVRAAVTSTLADLATHVGTITVHAPAGSQISVDGRDVGKAPIEDFEVAAGTVTVHVVPTDHDPIDRKVDVQGGKHELVDIVIAAPPPVVPAPVPAVLPPERSHIHPLVWVGASVGGAGLIVGAVTGALSLSKVNDLKKICPPGHCSINVDAEKSKANTLANVSNVGFAFAGAGAVLAGVGIGLSFRHDKDSPRVTMQPTGLSLDGAF